MTKNLLKKFSALLLTGVTFVSAQQIYVDNTYALGTGSDNSKSFIDYDILMGVNCDRCGNAIEDFTFDAESMTITGKDKIAANSGYVTQEQSYLFKVFPLVNHQESFHMFVYSVLSHDGFANQWFERDYIRYGEINSKKFKSLNTYEGKNVNPVLAPYNVDYVFSASKNTGGGVWWKDIFTSGYSYEGFFHVYSNPSDASGSIRFNLRALPKEGWYQDAVVGNYLKNDRNPQTLIKGKKQMMVVLVGSSHYSNGEPVSYLGLNESSYAGNHFVLDIPDVLAITSAKSSTVKAGEFFSVPVKILSDRDVVEYTIEKASSAFPDTWEKVKEGTLDEKVVAKVDGSWEIGFNGEWSDLFSDGETLFRIKLVSVNDEGKNTVNYNDLASVMKRIHLEAAANNSGSVKWSTATHIYGSSVDVDAGESLTLTAYSPTGKKFSNWTDEEGKIVSNSYTLKGKAGYFENLGKLTANYIDKDATNSTLDVYVKTVTRGTETTNYEKAKSPMGMDYHQGEDQITLHIDASSNNKYNQYVYYQVQIDDGEWSEAAHLFSLDLISSNNYKSSNDMDIVAKALSSVEGSNVKVRFLMVNNMSGDVESSKEVTYSNEISFNVMHKVTINCVGLFASDRCRDLKAWYTENGRYVDDGSIVEDVSVLERWYPHGATVTAAATPKSIVVLDRWEVCADGSNACYKPDGQFTVVTKDSTVEAVVSQELIYKVYFDNRKLTTVVYPLNGLDAGAALQLDAIGEQPLESFSIERATAFDNDKNPIAYKAIEDSIFFLEPGSYRLTINLGFLNENDKQVAAYCNDYAGCVYTDNAIFNISKDNMDDEGKTRMNRDYNHEYKGGDTIAYYYNFDVEGVKITFFDGKTSVGTRYVPKNGKLMEGSYSIVKEGYELAGWCKDAACKEKWDYSTPIAADVKLYAQWAEVKEESSSSAAQTSSSSSDKSNSSSSAKESSSSSVNSSSSSSAKSDDKSSSSKKEDKEAIVAAMSNYFTMSVSGRVVQIAGARIGSAYAVLDMQGRVMSTGTVNAVNTTMVLPRAGSYMVRVGSRVLRVNVK